MSGSFKPARAMRSAGSSEGTPARSDSGSVMTEANTIPAKTTLKNTLVIT
jgi:hypothetical protein